jgi:hypothetical protein
VRGWGAVDVSVDQHVVIEAVDRVVQRGGVEAKLDPRSADRVPQVQQAQPDPGGQALADPFLLSPPTHRVGVRISEGKAHLRALRRARVAYAIRRGNTLPLDAWGRPEDDPAVIVVASWTYLSQGYQSTGEAWLAASAAAHAREARRIAKEELGTTTIAA